MKLKNNIRFVLLGVACAALVCACSTKRNTPAARAYHELTTRYNVFFNAQQAYDETLKNQSEAFADAYSEPLPVYPFARIEGKTQSGGAFDAVAEKTEKAIREHSISAKPRRDPSQPQTQEYREWLRQHEFNPFIKNAWLLMGKAHVQNQDYEQAVAVFSQILQLFKNDADLISETQIWMMRAYTEMEWFYDAEDMAYLLQTKSLPNSLDALFTEAYAHFLMRRKTYADALPFLRKAADNERNTHQKKRLQYLLGQTLALLGENAAAFRAFEAVKGLSTPHELALNATIRQSEIASGAQQQQLLNELERMAKSTKNANYLDKIHYAAGNAYLHRGDTAKAIENYAFADKKSMANSLEKALAQVALGDVYFGRKAFIQAQPPYTNALSSLPQTHAAYARAAFRADVLKEFVPHAKAVAEQDSLRQLAKLPRDEQLRIIQKHISELRRAERSLERDAYLAEQQANIQPIASAEPSAAESAVSLAGRTGETAFYFHNPQLVAQGRTEFQRRWGNRPLADNWRTQSPLSPSPPLAESPSLPLFPSPSRQTADPHSPDFYLQQLPLTPEALQASDKIIENGLFEMALIAQSRLQDFDYAIGLYNRIVTDFPQSDYMPDVYYRLYIICLRNGNEAMAQTFKQRLMREFPENERAVAMRRPDFDTTLRNYAQAQDALYQQAYGAYRDGRPQMVRKYFDEFRSQFSDAELMPKFLLLNALSFAQQGDAENTEKELRELLQKFPQSEAAPLAQHIADGLADGRTLAADASLVSGGEWRAPSPQFAATQADTVRFAVNPDTAHVFMLAFERNALNKNALLFAAADFNFSRFQFRSFDVSFVPFGGMEALQIRSFRSLAEASQYARMAGEDEEFSAFVSAHCVPVLISEENLRTLSRGKSLAEYLRFYAENFGGGMPEKTMAAEKSDAVVPIEPEKTVPLETETRVIEPVRIEPQQDVRATPEARRAELERRQAEARRQQQETAPPKSRKQLLRERERERQQKIRQREREMKERQRQREAEIRRRQRQRNASADSKPTDA